LGMPDLQKVGPASANKPFIRSADATWETNPVKRTRQNGHESQLEVRKENTEILLNGGKRRPSRDDGDGEFVRFFASARKADRDCNIEPPASPYAIMRRAYPYRGENSGPGKDIVGKLDTQTRN